MVEKIKKIEEDQDEKPKKNTTGYVDPYVANLQKLGFKRNEDGEWVKKTEVK
jgi:hypothetical protein